MQSFELKFLGVTILQGVEFPIFLLIFEWALQQCSATALPVIPKSTPGDCNAAAHHWLNCRRVSIHAAQGRLYTHIRSLHRLGGRVLTFGCHGDSIGSVENSGSIFEFNNPVFTCLKFLDFLQGIEICAILAGRILPKCGCHGNFLSSLENLNSRSP